MTKNTNIEWADHTFNPWEGCNKVSPGCAHCYAEARNARFGGGVAVNWGPGAPRRRTSAANWQQPLKWEREAAAFMATHGRRQRVFCSSLADVFDNEVPETWRWDLFRLIAATPNLDWLLLTKRIGNASKMLNSAAAATLGDFVGANAWDLMAWPNVWLGATIVNQEEADRDIPKLLATPAAKRFLSIEPLLGPVTLPGLNAVQAWCPICKTIVTDSMGAPHEYTHGMAIAPKFAPAVNCMTVESLLNWVIVGGESGPKARPMHPDWARSLRDQCEAAGVPFLFKQWGEWMPISQMDEAEHGPLYVSKVKAKPHQDQGNIDDIYDKKCTVPSTVIHLDGSTHNLAEPMTFRQGTGAMQIFKVGKKAAGRMLDGRTWNRFPS